MTGRASPAAGSSRHASICISCGAQRIPASSRTLVVRVAPTARRCPPVDELSEPGSAGDARICEHMAAWSSQRLRRAAAVERVAARRQRGGLAHAPGVHDIQYPARADHAAFDRSRARSAGGTGTISPTRRRYAR